VPDELLGEPRLSVKIAAGEPGARTVTVTYLAHGFAWSADYVAHLNERGDAMTLAGWATLTNSTAAVFAQAQVQLVAGKLNILPAERGGSAAARRDIFAEDERASVDIALLRACFSSDDLPRRMEARLLRRERGVQFNAVTPILEVMVTAARVEREELGDYQLYRLPWRTDLNARQTKQVLFLDESEVRVERLYGFRLDSLTEPLPEDVAIPSLLLRFENTEAGGLGEPLPRGVVRVFESYAGRDVLAGEAAIGDRPVGLPVELVTGRALNVLLETTTEVGAVGRDRVVVAREHRVVNNKTVPIELEIRHGVEDFYTDVELEESSRPMRRRYGDLAWRFEVPPGEELLRYELSAREPNPARPLR
jgi:hypothetical protein